MSELIRLRQEQSRSPETRKLELFGYYELTVEPVYHVSDNKKSKTESKEPRQETAENPTELVAEAFRKVSKFLELKGLPQLPKVLCIEQTDLIKFFPGGKNSVATYNAEENLVFMNLDQLQKEIENKSSQDKVLNIMIILLEEYIHHLTFAKLSAGSSSISSISDVRLGIVTSCTLSNRQQEQGVQDPDAEGQSVPKVPIGVESSEAIISSIQPRPEEGDIEGGMGNLTGDVLGKLEFITGVLVYLILTDKDFSKHMQIHIQGSKNHTRIPLCLIAGYAGDEIKFLKLPPIETILSELVKNERNKKDEKDKKKRSDLPHAYGILRQMAGADARSNITYLCNLFDRIVQSLSLTEYDKLVAYFLIPNSPIVNPNPALFLKPFTVYAAVKDHGHGEVKDHGHGEVKVHEWIRTIKVAQLMPIGAGDQHPVEQ